MNLQCKYQLTVFESTYFKKGITFKHKLSYSNYFGTVVMSWDKVNCLVSRVTKHHHGPAPLLCLHLLKCDTFLYLIWFESYKKNCQHKFTLCSFKHSDWLKHLEHNYYKQTAKILFIR